MINLPEALNNKRDIIIKPVRERTGSIIAYKVILARLLKELDAEVNCSIVPAYKADLAYTADSSSWFTSLKAVAESAVQSAAFKLTELFSKESSNHLKRFVRSVKSATGTDLSGVFSTSDQKSLMETYIEQNTSLIQSLSDRAIKRTEQTIYRAKLGKWSANELSKELRKNIAISKNSADLIAVDQIASLNADLNEARQCLAGIDSYRWRGKQDGRERALHLSLEGKIYKWGEKTGAENGLPPGKPIRCRCVAEAVIPARK